VTDTYGPKTPQDPKDVDREREKGREGPTIPLNFLNPKVILITKSWWGEGCFRVRLT
jgi:hypothetical protein